METSTDFLCVHLCLFVRIFHVGEFFKNMELKNSVTKDVLE